MFTIMGMSDIYMSCFVCVVFVCLSQRSYQVEGVLTCDGLDPCRCRYSDGSGTIDISSLGFQNGSARFQDAVASFDGQMYSYNPCFPIQDGNCHNAAACRKSGNDYVDMGESSNFVFKYQGYRPLVTYSTADGRKTDVLLVCDENQTTPLLDVIGEVVPGTLSMNLWSRCCCPDKCPRVDPHTPDSGDLSVGYIFLIVISSVVVAYLVFGTLINFARHGVLKKEILPNYHTWSSMPRHIVNGCQCLFTCGKSRKDKYEAI